MVRMLSILVTLMALVGLVAVDGSALAQPKERKEHKEKDRKEEGDSKGNKDGKEKKAKKEKHHDAKGLVGDKVKKNGRHKFHENGKHSAHVDVRDGKIRGVSVKHADKGDVPVKKYVTKKKMAEAPLGGIQRVSLNLAQYGGAEYLGTTWIGFAYYDDWGDEVIYWFPYDMVYDPYTGAVEYFPV
ncbi:MAG: hypothetical protein M3R58_10065 [Pseudomonadota bacterium]|nr:hypothetical protein [Pseudomonadota bacterium]